VFHPYKQGYSVLPALQKLEGPPFLVDEDRDHFLAEKQKALRTQQVFLEEQMDPKVYVAFAEFMAEHGPAHLTETQSQPDCLNHYAMQVQEDIAIHRIQGGRDWLAAMHVCFPSSWRPEEKIGKSFAEIHAPVPGMNLRQSTKLAETMVHRGPFQRFVWSPIYEWKINYHPDQEKQDFAPDKPVVYVKVERQVIWGLPKVDAAIFLIRQFVVQPDLRSLYVACEGMNSAEREYKGVTTELLEYLSRKSLQ
jgi:hypothetical protein